MLGLCLCRACDVLSVLSCDDRKYSGSRVSLWDTFTSVFKTHPLHFFFTKWHIFTQISALLRTRIKAFPLWELSEGQSKSKTFNLSFFLCPYPFILIQYHWVYHCTECAAPRKWVVSYLMPNEAMFSFHRIPCRMVQIWRVLSQAEEWFSVFYFYLFLLCSLLFGNSDCFLPFA